MSVQAAHDDNAIFHDYLTSEVALEEPEVGSTHPNIPIDNNYNNEKFHFGMPGGSGDDEIEGDESDLRNVIPSASRRRLPVTELERFDLGSGDVDRDEGEDGDDEYADKEEEASQADDGSTQNVEDWGHSRFDLGTSDVDGYECEDGDDAGRPIPPVGIRGSTQSSSSSSSSIIWFQFSGKLAMKSPCLNCRQPGGSIFAMGSSLLYQEKRSMVRVTFPELVFGVFERST